MIIKQQKENCTEYFSVETCYKLHLKDNRIIFAHHTGTGLEHAFLINKQENWSTIYDALHAFFHSEENKNFFIEIYNQLNINSKEFEIATQIIYEEINAKQNEINHLNEIINDSKNLANITNERKRKLNNDSDYSCQDVSKKLIKNMTGIKPFEIDQNKFTQRKNKIFIDF